MQRLESIQILRGVAAMLVVCFHTNNGLRINEASIGPSAIVNFATWEKFGAIGVDVFFVISGFVMAFTMRKYRARPGGFFAQRVARTVPLAWLAAATAVVLPDLDSVPLTLGSLLSTLTFIPLTPTYAAPLLSVLWTLSFEFVLYGLVCLTLSLDRGPRTLLTLLVVLGIVGVVITPAWPLLRRITNPILLEFALGVLAYLLWSADRLPGRLVIAVGLLGAAALLAQALLGSSSVGRIADVLDGTTSLRRALQWGVPASLVMLPLLRWQPGSGALARLGRQLGDASYSI